MSATALESGTVSREELRAFYMKGRGLDGLRVMGKLMPEGLVAVEEPLAGAPSALPELYAGFLTAGRADARSRFLRELRQGVASLLDLLTVDDAKRAPASADKVAASLGGDAARFLSVSRLMAVFGRRAGKPAVMDTERRRRCEAALAVLEEAVRRQQDSPAFRLFQAGGAPVELSPDPCAEALDFCDRQLREIEPVLRALRVAKLEAAAAYDAAIHDEALKRFDWQAADPHEIAALTVPIAVESAERLSLNSFSRLLLSERPVQVLAASSGPDANVADPGAIALAHGGAFVVQSSMARPEHLSKAFAEMAQTLEPAVAVVSVPPVPLYRYDPDREGGWADRFELAEADTTGFDALVLSARFRDHWRAIPPNAPDEWLTELSEYLKKPAAGAIPFVRATDDAGNLQRIAVTREMVRLCLDRSRAWEMLTALAAKPGGARQETKPAEDCAAIREEAAKDAYMRVIALLADPESLLRRP